MSINNDTGKLAAIIICFGFCLTGIFLLGAYVMQNDEAFISNIVAEYKSGNIICAELGHELVCRRKK